MKSNTWLKIVFKTLSFLIITVLLALIYWSSLLQEERIRNVEDQLTLINDKISYVGTSKPFIKQNKKTARPHIDNSYPNLVEEDLYFSETLPKLLGKDFKPNGILKMAIIGRYPNLQPFNLWHDVDKWYQFCQKQISSNLYGKYETLSQDMAIKIEERKGERDDRTDFWVHLREGVFWQPLEQAHFPPDLKLSPHFLKKHPVTAYDFAFYINAVKNPHVDIPGAVAERIIFKDMEKVKVIDDLTLVITYKKSKLIENGVTQTLLPYQAKFNVGRVKPLPCFVYKYTSSGKKICPDDNESDFYAKSSLWAQQFSNHFANRVIVSCGAWIFDGMTEQEVRFRRNPDFYNQWQALYEKIVVYFLDSPGAIFRDFLSQKIDVCNIEAKNLIELEKFLNSPFYKNISLKSKINTLKYIDRSFSYVGWNEKRPYFSEKKVRQALSQAIDFRRLIQQNLNGQAVIITGPFPYMSQSYNKLVPQWIYDPDEAKRILQEEGWYDSDGDGIIDKEINGKRIPFRFTLTYYIKNLTTKANAEMVASQLKDIGIDCILHGVDITEISALIDDKNLDALLLAWSQQPPPEDPEQLWSSNGANEKGSSNFIGFSNKNADRLIRKINFEHDRKKRNALYHELHALIHDEAPYAFLYDVIINAIYWDKVKNIFIPSQRQDLIPGADVNIPSFEYGYKEDDDS